MDHEVLVSPMEILHSLYLDLVQSDSSGGGYMIKQLPKDDNETSGYKLSVLFNFTTTVIPSGHICLNVSGEQSEGPEAVKSVLTALYRTLRQEYNIFLSDYNYARISEKIGLYDEMEYALQLLSQAYWQISTAAEDCYKGLYLCYAGLSVCLSSSNVGNNLMTVEGLGGFHGWLSAAAGSIKQKTTARNALVTEIMHSDPTPESLSFLKKTTNNSMIVDWTLSYHVLNLLFNTCLQKMNAQASVIDIIPLSEASYQACIHVSFEPNEFLSEPASSIRAAKAKLLFTVLRHIDVVLGFRIIDVNHNAMEYINCQIDKFNWKIQAIWYCGKLLQELAMSCHADFMKKSVIAIHTESTNCNDQLVIQTLDTCGNHLQTAMCKLENALRNLSYAKVDRAFLEHYVRRNN